MNKYLIRLTLYQKILPTRESFFVENIQLSKPNSLISSILHIIFDHNLKSKRYVNND